MELAAKEGPVIQLTLSNTGSPDLRELQQEDIGIRLRGILIQNPVPSHQSTGDCWESCQVHTIRGVIYLLFNCSVQ